MKIISITNLKKVHPCKVLGQSVIDTDSVIDYAIFSKGAVNLIQNFRVEGRTKSLHYPILVEFGVTFESVEKPMESQYIETKYNLNCKTKATFQQEMERYFNNETLHRIICDTDDVNTNINDCVSNLTDNLLRDVGTYFVRPVKKAWKTSSPRRFDK